MYRWLYCCTLCFLVTFLADVERNYRLPKNVNPLFYELDIDLVKNGDNLNTFAATLSISLQSTEETEEIQLHYRDLTIVNMNFTSETDPEEGIQIMMDEIEYDNETEIIKLPLNRKLNPNNTYKLYFSYNGNINEEVVGIFKSSYLEDNKEKIIIGTQLYPDHARSVFPCFDEPSFKAIFELSIITSLEQEPFSNELRNKTEFPKMRRRTIFNKTPDISPSSLTFHVSNLNCSELVVFNEGIQHRICARNSLGKFEKEFALNITTQILEHIENFTSIPYNYMSVNKLDEVIYPELSGSIDGSIGLMNFQEDEVVWNSLDYSEQEKLSVVLKLSEKLVRLWFNEMVTPNWWSDIFLEEGFKGYAASSITSKILLKWQLEKLFVIDILQTALDLDNDAKLSISAPISNPKEISREFINICKFKGASLLRMIEHIMTTHNFTTGIKEYLNKYRFESAEINDFWSSLSPYIYDLPRSINLQEIMQTWIENPGYPLVKVSLDTNENKIKISQEPFSHSEKAAKWHIPISLTLASDPDKFEDTIPKYWLTPEDEFIELSVPESVTWIIINNKQTAYYRVVYDDAIWNNIVDALNNKENFDGIVDLNRAQIVDDFFNLAKIGKKSYGDVLKLIAYLRKEDSFYPWFSALQSAGDIYERIGDQDLKDRLTQEFLRLMENQHEDVSFVIDETDTNPTEVKKKILLLTWACRLGLEKCINEAVSSFQKYQDNNKKPDKNLRRVIFCTFLAVSSDHEEDWNFLWEKYLQSNIRTEQEDILESLSCVKNKTILVQYLDKILDDPEMKKNHAFIGFTSVFLFNSDGLDVVLDYILAKHENIGSKLDLVEIIEEIAQKIKSNQQLDKLKLLSEDGSLEESARAAVMKWLDLVPSNLKWIERVEEELISAFTTTTTTNSETSSVDSTLSTPDSTPTTTDQPSSAISLKSGIIYVTALLLAGASYF